MEGETTVPTEKSSEMKRRQMPPTPDSPSPSFSPITHMPKVSPPEDNQERVPRVQKDENTKRGSNNPIKALVDNLSIATKITCLVGFMAVGSLVVYLIVRNCVSSLSTQLQDVGETQIAAVRHNMMADMMHDGLRAVALRAIVAKQSGDTESLTEATEEVKEFIKNSEEALEGLSKLSIPSEAVHALSAVRPTFTSYGEKAAEIVTLASSNKVEQALAALPEFQKVFSQLEGEMEQLGDTIQNNASNTSKSAVAYGKTASNTVSMVFIALVGISLFVGWYIAKNITKALGLAVNAFENNDLTALAGIESRDEVGRIATAVTATLHKIEQDAARMNAAAERAREMEKAAEREAVERQRLAAEQENAERQRTLQMEKEREREVTERQRREAADRQAQAEADSRRQREAAELERRKSEEVQRKVDEILKVVEAASVGDLTQSVNVSGTDAIGQVGIALQKLLSRLRTNIKQAANRTVTVGTSASEMETIGQSISQHAAKTLEDSNMASLAADEINRNIQTVASAAEQMSASIDEVSRNASNAARIAAAALDCAKNTSATVLELGKSSTEIGNVVKTINSIAEQTNLLALNATIEAARAGEAGKGFAVVANEVKDLSKETAHATEDISNKVNAIQSTTKEAVVAIEEITKVINEIAEIQTTIAAALEQQSATTRCISSNVADVAHGASEIVGGVSRVVDTANTASQKADQAKESAQQLSEVAKALEDVMNQFTV